MKTFQKSKFASRLTALILLTACLMAPSIEAIANEAGSQSPDPYADESNEERDARMAWWRDARFGMFIHWGVYAVPAGWYEGEKTSAEWILGKNEIPLETYKGYAQQFNPTAYDPAAWAELAKKAGMRYIVITAKHHDGFALYPSEHTDWDIEGASPYGKDLLAPLAEAARAEDLKFGLYYSHCRDWTHPGGFKFQRYEDDEGWDEAHKGSYQDYFDQIAIPQLEEILTRYQPDIIWWDTPGRMSEENAQKMQPYLSLVPGIISNNRLGGGQPGDYNTPEQHIPAAGHSREDFEVCMTMNGSWGYRSHDHDWKSSTDLIQKLCDIASKGGNFLLNVGPTAEGRFPEESIERLEQIGAWMDINSESIYGTTGSPFYRLTWGRCTKKLSPTGATLYLHVFDWPEDGQLFVPGLKTEPASVQLLANGEFLSASSIQGSNPGLIIHLPKQAIDPAATVIKLSIQGALDVEANLPKQAADGTVVLTPAFADVHNRLGTHAGVQRINGNDVITRWERSSRSAAWLSWNFEIETPGRYLVKADVAVESDSTLSFGLSEQERSDASLNATAGLATFNTQEIGTLHIKEAGKQTLEFHPDLEQWDAVNLKTVTLVPAP